MFCTRCGASIPPDQSICPHCGNPQEAAAAAPPESASGFSASASAGSFSPPLGVKAQTGAWISQGWELVKADLGLMALAALIYLVLNSVIPLVLIGPTSAGFHLMFMKKLRGQRPELGELFQGFNWFLPTLVASLLIILFVSLGGLVCIIPGLVLGAMFMFPYLFIVDKRMDFWPAMLASAAIVKQDYVGFTIFYLLLALLITLGVLACVVGVLFTLPLWFAAITVAYRDVVGFE